MMELEFGSWTRTNCLFYAESSSNVRLWQIRNRIWSIPCLTVRTISAFKRQLNLYGFRLVSRGENTNAYCNRELLVPGTTPAHLRTRTENTIPNARAYGEPELYQAMTNRTPMQALTTVLFSQESNSSNDSAPNVHALDEVDIISLFDLLVWLKLLSWFIKNVFSSYVCTALKFFMFSWLCVGFYQFCPYLVSISQVLS
jgi:hypothetical protein